MPALIREPSRLMLFGGIAIAAVLAVLGGFFFFANVPNPGAAKAQILASSPQIGRADIDRIIAERNAFAPRPSNRIANADSVSGAAAPPIAAAAELQPDHSLALPQTNEGDDLFRRGLYPEALAFWRRSAEAGDRWSAYRLGVEYIDGKPNVVARDLAEGAKWIRVAAELNDAHAQFELGSLLEYGTGVQADLAEAALWYSKSADRGHAQGQYNFATMLETGEGVPRDDVEALKFYILAAKAGFSGVPSDREAGMDESSSDPREMLKSRMSQADIEEAESRASKFRPVQD